MDLQTRKLNLITYLSQLEDESFINKIEDILYAKNPVDEFNFKPFTQEELIHRIKRSESDFLKGNCKTQEELEDISANW